MKNQELNNLFSKLNKFHLRDDADYLECSICLRKSWSGEINSICNMTQPNGNKCKGVLINPKPTK